MDREIHDWAKSTGRKGYTGNRSRDTQVSAEDRQAFYKDQMNNYDNRRAMETFNLAKNDEEFRNSLGGKMRDFVDSYESKDKKEKDNNTVGISNYRELDTIRQFQKKYHKHKLNNGGEFSSANDYGGNTEHMGNALRNHYDRNFLTKDDQVEAPVDDAQTPDSLLPDDYTPSAELTRARNIVDTFEDGVLKSQDGLLSSAALGEIGTKNTVADDTQAAASQNAIAQSYLNNHTLNLKEGFKKYGIKTSGPNSTASRNDELMQGLG